MNVEPGIDDGGFDIFIFNNGQEYTPPRKYHLRQDELLYWEATLNYLARAQYGSLHSTIELYTIEGVKVRSPADVSGGNAYVAVAPTETFIDSGYEKYLVKASRSWEKRQLRKLSNKPDEIPAELETTKIEVKNDKTTVRRTSNTSSVNQRTLKYESKQNAKKKLQESQVKPQQHSSVIRKHKPISQPPTPSSMPVKTPIKRRQFASKYSKIPKRIDDKMIIPEKNKPMEPASPEVKKELIDTNITKPNSNTLHKNIINSSIEIDTTTLLNSTEDQFISELLYKNVETDATSTFNEIQFETQEKPLGTNKRESADPPGRTSLVAIKAKISFQNLNPIEETDGLSHLEPTTNHRKLGTVQEPSDPTPPQAATSLSNLINNDINKTTDWLSNLTEESTTLFSKSQPSDIRTMNLNNQLVANKKDVINLNLNIEIRNPEVAIQAKSNVNSCKSRSLTDINKQGVDDSESAKQNKSVQSLVNDFFPRLCCRNDENLVYIQCPCIEDSFRPDPKVLCPEVRTCFVLLPVLTRAGKECCKCETNEKIPEKPLETPGEFVLPKTAVSERDSKVIIQADQRIFSTNKLPVTPQNEFLVDCFSKCQIQRCSECGGTKVDVSQTSTSRTTSWQPEKKFEPASFRQNSKPRKNMCDIGAQTDWCSTMLEARLHEDGHYTFHLPSIKVIKQFNYL